MTETIDITKTIETMQRFLDMLSAIDKNYDALYDIVGKAEKEQQDLLHDIEFSTFCGRDGFKKAKELKLLRMNRRAVKNTMEAIDPLREYLRTHQKVKIDLHKIVQQIQCIKNEQNRRTYTPRIRNDLKIADQHFSVEPIILE